MHPVVPIEPAAVILLCILAGVGTAMMLPGRRERIIRPIGAGLALIALLVFIGLLVANVGTGGIGPYFWLFSAVAIFGSARVVTHEKPVYSALYFVLTVFASAGLFILLLAEFMAAALVLIYAGAILITYVFVIMLASEAGPAGAGGSGLADCDRVSREPIFASFLGFFLMGILMFVVWNKAQILPVPHGPVVEGTTQNLGEFLFRRQLVNLELAGLILTVGMIGAIMIARRKVYAATAAPVVSDLVVSPMTPIDDNPHSIPVLGTDNPRQKEYPEA